MQLLALMKAPAAGAVVATAALLLCAWAGCAQRRGTHADLTAEERIVLRLDSLDYAIQTLRRQGSPINEPQKRIGGLTDTLRLLRSDSSFRRTFTESRPSRADVEHGSGVLNWLVAIACGIALVAGALAARAAAVSKRTRASRTARPLAEQNQEPSSPSSSRASAATSAPEDPAVRMVRTRILGKPEREEQDPASEAKLQVGSAAGSQDGEERAARKAGTSTGRKRAKKATDSSGPESGVTGERSVPTTASTSSKNAAQPTSPSQPDVTPHATPKVNPRATVSPDPASSPADAVTEERTTGRAPQVPPAPQTAASKKEPDAARPAGTPRAPQDQVTPRQSSPEPESSLAAAAADVSSSSQQEQAQEVSDQPPAAKKARKSSPPRGQPPSPRTDATHDELRRQVLQAARAGKPVEQISRELELSTDHVRLILKVVRSPDAE